MLFSEVSPSGELQYQLSLELNFLLSLFLGRWKMELTDWIKMGQVVSDGLDWAGWRIFFRPNRLRGREARLDGFSSMADRTGNFFIQLAVLFSLWSFPEYKHAWLYLALVFTSTLSKIEYKVEPDRSLQLCWTSAVGRTEFTTFVQTLDLLFGDRLLVSHASYLSRLSEVFHEGIKNLVGFCKSGATDDWELLAVRWRAKKPVNGGTNGFHWRRLVVRAILLSRRGVKGFQTVIELLLRHFNDWFWEFFSSRTVQPLWKNDKYYVSYDFFTLIITKVTKVAKVVFKYFIAFNTHLPIKIFSPYFVDLLVLMGLALSTILLISSGEISSNRDIFFIDDAAKIFFPTSKISAQEICHQFFLIWSNLTIMAHIMGLGNQSESWKIIILS